MSSEKLDRSNAEEIKEGLLQPTIKTVIAIVILLTFQFISRYFPAADITVLQPDITIATLIYSAITLVIFGAILNYATTVGTVLSQILDSIPNVDRIVQITSLLFVLLWAYSVFWWLPYFRDNPSAYNLMFLVIILSFITWLSYLLYSAREEMARAVAKAIRTETSMKTEDQPKFMIDDEEER